MRKRAVPQEENPLMNKDLLFMGVGRYLLETQEALSIGIICLSGIRDVTHASHVLYAAVAWRRWTKDKMPRHGLSKNAQKAYEILKLFAKSEAAPGSVDWEKYWRTVDSTVCALNAAILGQGGGKEVADASAFCTNFGRFLHELHRRPARR